MATVTPGTDGTCKATTAEGQLQEVMTFIAIKQGNGTTNPTGASNVQAQHDQSSRLFSGTYQLPATQAIGTNGALSITATPYLVGPAFSVGSGGTFKSNSAEAYALEVLMYLQQLEQTPAKNPNSRNYVNGTYNSETKVYSGSFSIPVSLELDADGSVSYVADEYLLT